VSRLQASRDVAARVLAPSVEALDTPLGPHGSHHAPRGLLLGAPVLTETGLATAGDGQREAGPPGLASSRRTMCTSLPNVVPSGDRLKAARTVAASLTNHGLLG
jgi:hypothetical protein